MQNIRKDCEIYINFYYEVKFKLNSQSYVRNWLKEIAIKENFGCGEIAIVFTTDEKLLELNKKHLNHNYLTDILSFDSITCNSRICDLIVSVERVKENASLYSCSFSEELNRVMAHGLLHLCGHKDSTNKEKKLIRELENKYLRLLTKIKSST